MDYGALFSLFSQQIQGELFSLQNEQDQSSILLFFILSVAGAIR
jgi:hypothetical protein